jgi:hypothetical protein
MPNESIVDKNKEELVSKKVLILIFSALFAPMILLFFVWGYNPQILKTLGNLHQIAAETPVYPDFKEFNSNSVIKEKHGSLSFYYDTPAYSAGFGTVKEFYREALLSKGWRLVEEGTYGGNTVGVTFRKGEYSISLYYSEGGTEGWDYAISYGWDSP